MADRLQKLVDTIFQFADERDWGKFHTPKNLAMALSVETAELMEIFQWLTPEQSQMLSESQMAQLKDELADVYIYLLKLAANFNVDLIETAHMKLKKNAIKYPVEKVRGHAKKYTEI